MEPNPLVYTSYTDESKDKHIFNIRTLHYMAERLSCRTDNAFLQSRVPPSDFNLT